MSEWISQRNDIKHENAEYPDSGFDDSNNDFTEENGRDNNDGRAAQFSEILREYGDHPTVMKKVDTFRVNPQPLTFVTKDHLRYQAIVDQFPYIDNREVITGLFQLLDGGLEVWNARDEAARTEEGDLINFAVAHQVIFLSNLGLVLNEAQRYKTIGGMTRLDIVNEGTIGLQKAIAGFDPSLKFKFSTYATKFIRGHIRRAIADQARAVRLPVHAHEKYGKMLDLRKELSRERGDEPSDNDLVDEFIRRNNVKPKEAWSIWKAGPYDATSLDAPVFADDDNSDTVGDSVLGRNTHSTELVEKMTTELAVQTALHSKELNDRDKLILILSEGLENNLPDLDIEIDSPANETGTNPIDYRHHIAKAAFTGGMKLSTIASVLGMSGEGARHARNKAYRLARDIIRKELGNPLVDE